MPTPIVHLINRVSTVTALIRVLTPIVVSMHYAGPMDTIELDVTALLHMKAIRLQNVEDLNVRLTLTVHQHWLAETNIARTRAIALQLHCAT